MRKNQRKSARRKRRVLRLEYSPPTTNLRVLGRARKRPMNRFDPIAVRKDGTQVYDMRREAYFDRQTASRKYKVARKLRNRRQKAARRITRNG